MSRASARGIWREEGRREGFKVRRAADRRPRLENRWGEVTKTEEDCGREMGWDAGSTEAPDGTGSDAEVVTALDGVAIVSSWLGLLESSEGCCVETAESCDGSCVCWVANLGSAASRERRDSKSVSEEEAVLLCEPAEVLGGVESGRGGGAADWSCWGGRDFWPVADGCRGVRWSCASPTFGCAVVPRCGWAEDKERLEDVGLAASGLLDFGLRTFARRDDLRDLKLGFARSLGSSGLFARWWLAMKGRASSVAVDMLGS